MGTSGNFSTLKDFLASIAAIRGDLSNITAPPFVLDTKSVVELPGFWAERPAFFVAAAACAEPAERALAVLRWFLVSLKNQQHAGRAEDDGVRKPLNAFLGECFLARWHDDCGETVLVAEQVSHHPPVTACRLQNEEHGVYAEGFARQEISLSLGNIAIKQTGHALVTLKKHGDETYLIPLPDVKVKGILSGLAGTYPELEGRYTLPSTSGYFSVIEFSGQSLLGSSKKHEFTAKLYAPGTPEEEPLYTAKGHWNDKFTIYKGSGSLNFPIETIVLNDLPTTPMQLQDVDTQDPWESRRAWKGVREALLKRDMAGTVKAKSAIEQGQRDMRRDEERAGRTWHPLFFKAYKEDKVATSLYRSILQDLKPEATVAVWKFDEALWKAGVSRPFHESLTPDNRNGVVDSGRPLASPLLNGGRAGWGAGGDDDGASVASFMTAHEDMPGPVEQTTPKAAETVARAEPIEQATPKAAGAAAQTEPTTEQTPTASAESLAQAEPTEPKPAEAVAPVAMASVMASAAASAAAPPAAVKPAPPSPSASPASPLAPPAEIKPAAAAAAAAAAVVQPPTRTPPRAPIRAQPQTPGRQSMSIERPAVVESTTTPDRGNKTDTVNDNSNNSGRAPSNASTSPSSTRRGKRQKARESIGKFRFSLTSGLKKKASKEDVE